MNHLDLFSGIGGFSLGLQQAGIEPDWIGFSDIDKYANQVFKRRFPNAEELGSITDIQSDRLPRVDLITFGFPCQDLSIAGSRGGLKANRSSLFFEAIKIVQDKKPKYFIFENVKGIFSSNGGKDFDIVLRSIADIGYDGQWELCNTRWYLPQNRERIYFVGHIRGECRPKVFPIGEKPKNGRGEVGKVFPAILSRDYKGVGNMEMALVQVDKIANGDAGRVFDPNGISCTLKSEGGGWGAKTGLYKINVLGNLKGEDGHECHNVHNPNGIAPTVRNNHGKITMIAEPEAGLFERSKIRRLTPKECCRLQGFPDDWVDGQSDTQKYRQLGNAVSVPVVQAIMERMKDVL